MKRWVTFLISQSQLRTPSFLQLQLQLQLLLLLLLRLLLPLPLPLLLLLLLLLLLFVLRRHPERSEGPPHFQPPISRSAACPNTLTSTS